MPVIVGDLAGLEQLQSHQHGVRGGALAAILLLQVGRIDQPEHAPFRLAVETMHVGDGLNGVVERRPFPNMGQHGSVGIFAVGRHVGSRRRRPQSFDAQVAQLLVELAQ